MELTTPPPSPSPLIIGLGSRARVGKDYAARYITRQFANSTSVAFADALREDLHILLGPQGIDVWTQDPTLKEVIRPTLVAYGTHLWRRLDPNHWIDKAFERIDRGPKRWSDLVVIPDVRYVNEVEAIQARGGVYVQIENPHIPFINREEEIYSPQCAALADFTLTNLYNPAEPDNADAGFLGRIDNLVDEVLSRKKVTA